MNCACLYSTHCGKHDHYTVVVVGVSVWSVCECARHHENDEGKEKVDEATRTSPSLVGGVGDHSDLTRLYRELLEPVESRPLLASLAIVPAATRGPRTTLCFAVTFSKVNSWPPFCIIYVQVTDSPQSQRLLPNPHRFRVPYHPVCDV